MSTGGAIGAGTALPARGVPVAVTGIGVVSAVGSGVGPFFDALVAGRSGCGTPRRSELPPGAVVAEVEDLAVRDVVRTPVGRRIDRTSLLALAAARLALDDAGLGAAVASGDRAGLALGSAFGNLSETEGYLERLLARGTGNPLVFPNLVLNAPLGYASIELGITGPGAMLSEQEASGEAAVQWGARLVADGAVDVCLAGGADEITPMLWRIRQEFRALAAAAPRPLDRDARGACPGEGAAVLVLEPLERARGRGARVYARLVPDAGFAVPSPVHGWPRDRQAVVDGLRARLADVDAVVGSASGKPALDTLEAAVLAAAAPGVAVTAPRGAVGDFGAAGALSVAVAALAVARGVVPPTAGCERPRERGLDVVRGAARAGRVRAAVVTGLARGGIVRPVRLETT